MGCEEEADFDRILEKIFGDMMDEKVKVSVIVPVYNAEKYLRECLDSIVGQTMKDLEIICIDDGSEDKSLDILRNYEQKDNRFTVLCQEHLGGGAARNLGLKNAQGEYLSFLDADDFFELNMLEKIYTHCKNHAADIGVFGVSCYHQTTGAQGHEPSGLRKEYLPDKEVFSWKDMPKYIFNAFHNWPWNKLFRREFIFEKGVLFQEIYRTNDLLFTNRALILASRIVVLDNDLIHYRIQTRDNCQSTNYLYPDDFFKALLSLRRFLVDEGIYEAVRQSFINHAADACVSNIISLEFGNAHKNLYEQLKQEILPVLNINEFKLWQYYSFNYNTYLIVCKILSLDYEEFLVDRANYYKQVYIEQKFEDFRKDQIIKALR